jgi:tellurium resistance protein TerZ
VAIQLSKGQRISLQKTAPKLRRVALGLAWEPIKTEGFFARLFDSRVETVDLDASCACLDGNGKSIEAVWFGRLASSNGAIRHSGDNRTGDGDGDDETIFVDLPSVDARITALIFTINSFSGQTFERVKASSCRLIDTESKQTLASFALDAQGKHTAMLMVALLKKGSDWEMSAIGNTGEGRTYKDLAVPIREWVKNNQNTKGAT